MIPVVAPPLEERRGRDRRRGGVFGPKRDAVSHRTLVSRVTRLGTRRRRGHARVLKPHVQSRSVVNMQVLRALLPLGSSVAMAVVLIVKQQRLLRTRAAGFDGSPSARRPTT